MILEPLVLPSIYPPTDTSPPKSLIFGEAPRASAHIKKIIIIQLLFKKMASEHKKALFLLGVLSSLPRALWY